ncbi:hypothetical protein Tco_1367007, partial [Tanacetum coccineum]
YAMNSRTASNLATGANDSSKSIPSSDEVLPTLIQSMQNQP